MFDRKCLLSRITDGWSQDRGRVNGAKRTRRAVEDFRIIFHNQET